MTAGFFLTLISGALLSLSLVVCFYYLTERRIRRRNAWAIPAFFGLIAWFAVSALLDQAGFYESREWTAGFARGTTLLVPPLAWFFILTLSTEQWRFRWWHGLHFLPALVSGLILAAVFADPPAPVNGEPFAETAMRGFWFVFVAWCSLYLVASIRVLQRDSRRIRDFFSFGDNPQRRRQAYVFLALMLPWASLTLEMGAGLFLDLPDAMRVIGGGFRLACVFVLCIYALQPRALLLEEEDGLKEPAAAPKYARSALAETDAARIREKLRQAMERDRLYRDPLLTLRKLSERTGVPQHHLSQVLNTVFGKSFFEYVNAARIQEACALLRESELPVLAIAEEVGFNSRSTFNAAFKRETGQTPRGFRAR